MIEIYHEAKIERQTDKIQFIDLGFMHYLAALDLQRAYHLEVVAGRKPEAIFFVQHPPVITLGRGARRDSLFARSPTAIPEGALEPRSIEARSIEAKSIEARPIEARPAAAESIEVVDVERGGKATYHGPGQLVIYPILNLQLSHGSLPKRDVGAYLQSLELWLSNALESLGVLQIARPAQLGKPGGPAIQVEEDKSISPERSLSPTGVWVANKKVASIGVAVRQWVTLHGVSVNVTAESLVGFQHIQPCGYSPDVMTCLEAVLATPLSIAQLIEALKLNCQFGLE